MKKLFAVFLLIGFAIAVCHAVPYHSGSDPTKIEIAKKHFELQAFDMPVVFDVPAAPSIVYDLILPGSERTVVTVLSQCNSPPADQFFVTAKLLTEESYSMAGWRC